MLLLMNNMLQTISKTDLKEKIEENLVKSFSFISLLFFKLNYYDEDTNEYFISSLFLVSYNAN